MGVFSEWNQILLFAISNVLQAPLLTFFREWYVYSIFIRTFAADMNKKLQAHSAIFLANTIFGLGVPVTKLLLDEWVTPMGYMASRSLGACIVFWLIAAFMPKEHVERKDLITILAGGLLGFVISQTLTAWALDYTSPVYFSLIATLTPVAVMLCAALTIDHYSQCGLEVYTRHADEVRISDFRHRDGAHCYSRIADECALYVSLGMGWCLGDALHCAWCYGPRFLPDSFCDEVFAGDDSIDLYEPTTRDSFVRSHYAGTGCVDLG